VAGTAGTGTNRHVPRVSLNSDGQRHTLENVLTVVTLTSGLASFVIGMIVRNSHSPGPGLVIAATVTGLVALFPGLYAQMVSATREERVLIVAGIIAGFVGLALGLSHGGLTA
jgi:hypothetical protein